jgi:hypothetical protein
MFGDDEEQEKPSGWRRYGVPAAVGIFVLGGAAGIMLLFQSGSTPPRPHREPPHITSIKLPPPPPPPPPPPQTQQPPKPVEQTKAVAISKPRVSAPPKLSSPPAQVSTSITGSGPSGLANGNGGGGDCIGADCGTGDGSGGGDVAYYEVLMKDFITQTLHGDEDLRSAKYSATIALVLGSDGHVEHVSFENFEGDSVVRQDIIKALNHAVASGDFPSELRNGKPWVIHVRAS